MLLAIDAGNTHIKIGCIEDDEILYISHIATDLNRTEYEYAVLIQQVLELGDVACDKFDGAIVSSVVPPLTETLRSAIRLITGQRALVVGSGLKTGLNILIDNPAQLGSDLVVGAVAARAAYTPPILIFGMGTATTISVIDAHGNYLGGALYPGVALSMNALSRGTSQLPTVNIEPPEKVISANTIDCMKSGAIFGTASMVDGMIDRMEAELGEKASLIATGGLADRIVPYCSHKLICDNDLLLRGLAILYHKNKRT
jgi:type III pantothenate kinase